MEPAYDEAFCRFSRCLANVAPDIELANSIVVVLAESASQARVKSQQAALEMFPPTVEWYDHRSEVIEIEQGMTLDSYRLRGK